MQMKIQNRNVNVNTFWIAYRMDSDIWGLGYVVWQTVLVSCRCTEVLWYDSVRPVSTEAFGAF